MTLRRLGGGEWISDEELRIRQRATVARLKRVNRTILQWDEYEVSLTDPTRPPVERPLLSREALKSLRSTLMEVLGEMEHLLGEDKPVQRVN